MQFQFSEVRYNYSILVSNKFSYRIGGHLEVLQLLAKYHSDIDSQDNRGISCLMAAFRKGHIKVVKWLVKHAKQFPADSDCKRFMQTVSDKVTLICFSVFCLSDDSAFICNFK